MYNERFILHSNTHLVAPEKIDDDQVHSHVLSRYSIMKFANQSRILLDHACLMNKALQKRPGIDGANFLRFPIRCFSATSPPQVNGNPMIRRRESFRFRSEFIIPNKKHFFVPVVSFSTDDRIRSPPYKTPLSTDIHRLQQQRLLHLGHSRDFVTKQRLHTLLRATQVVFEQRRKLSDQTTQDGGNTKKDEDKKKKKLKRQRIQVPNYGPDADRAVRSLQNARKEKARAKTAANIRRALYGNTIICVAKLGAWLSSGSSVMFSEFVHSVVDCGNQSLLLMGIRDSTNDADRRHPYGYGKAVYFWALVSALGTFFLGAGVSMSHAVGELMEPSLQVITSEVWGVLALSFMVDGYVLYRTVNDVRESKPSHISLSKHISNLRDPATMAVLLEDGAACLGIVIAIAGIGASHMTGMLVFDGIAGVGVSCLLGAMGLALVRVNHRFLLGQGVSKEMTDNIEKIVKSRRSIDNVYRIQSQ
jgi:cation diffusion facilitator family transporter